MAVFEVAKNVLISFGKLYRETKSCPSGNEFPTLVTLSAFCHFFPFDLDFPQKSTIRSEAVTQREASRPGKILILSFLSLIEELGTTSISLGCRIGVLSLSSWLLFVDKTLVSLV